MSRYLQECGVKVYADLNVSHKFIEYNKMGIPKGSLQHTITHELAHATWNASMSSTKAKAAGKEITSLYKKWLKDEKKKGYGSYGKTNVSEFFAEGVTKAIHGNADKYTKKLKNIVGKYQL